MTYTRETNSIFDEEWWLEATAPGQWDAVEVEDGGRVVARLPFVAKKRKGLRLLTQPSLTQTLGPWLEPSEGKTHRQLAKQISLQTKLLGKLPTHDIFRQSFHPAQTNWLPFYWEGFSQSTRYSYAIDLLGHLEGIESAFSPSARGKFRKATKLVEVSEDESLDALLDVNEKTFKRQGMEVPYKRELVESIDDAVKAHAQRLVLIARDQNGRVHGGSYIVGDSRRVYLLINGGDPELRNSGAGTLLIWEAIKRFHSSTEIFDFEGSMIPGVEEFYRGFGASQVPYFSISGASTRLGKAALRLRPL